MKNLLSFFCFGLLGCFIGLLSVLYVQYLYKFNQLVLIVTLLPIVVYIISSINRHKGVLDISNPILLYGTLYFIIFGVGGFLSEETDHNFKTFIGGIATLIGMLGYLLGYFLSGFFIKRKKSFSQIKIASNIVEKNINVKLKKSVFFEKIIFFIGILSYIFYILKIGNLPIFMSDLEQARVDASIKGGAYLRILVYFLIVSSTIGFLNSYINKLFNNKHLKHSILRYILSIIMLFTLGNRSPIYNILFTSVLVFLFIKYGGKLKFSKLINLSVVLAVGIICFVGGIGTYRVLNTETFYSYPEFRGFINNRDYVGLSLFLFYHYLTIGFENFMQVLDVVPNYLPYKYGLSYIEPLLTVLPGTQYTLDMQIKIALGQSYFGGGTIPSMLGEAFVNFGYFGWFFVPFISMVFLRLVFYYFRNNSNDMFIIILYAYLLNYFSNSLLSGLASSSIFPYISLLVYSCYGLFLQVKITTNGRLTPNAT